MKAESPSSPREAAEALRSASTAGFTVGFRGCGTKARWGNVVPDPDVEIRTEWLNRIVEHNPGDLTAVLQAGVPLREAQAAFAESGQMAAIGLVHPDATIGGIVATADYGSLRHRYGAVRDLLLGITVVLSDGTVAKSGGKVIKNVAGYDLAKLFAGSFGTLGMIVQVAVRLHPRPAHPTELVASTTDPDAVQGAAMALAHEPLELESVDVSWSAGRGHLVIVWSGERPEATGERVRRLLEGAGFQSDSITGEVPPVAPAFSGLAAIVRVSALPMELSKAIRVCEMVPSTLWGLAGRGLFTFEVVG